MKSNQAQAEFVWDDEAAAAAEENAPEPPQPACTASATILDRIKKLLRLAADQRGNPHEAERAASLAFELAEKHHVDIASLDLDEKVERIIGDYFPGTVRTDRIATGAANIAVTFFHVEGCKSGDRVLFVGRETDVAIAGYIFAFLRRACRECLSAWEAGERKARRKLNTCKRSNYIAGFFYAIAGKLNGSGDAMLLSASTPALVVAEEAKREAKMEELVPSRAPLKLRDHGRNRAAIIAGLRDGDKTQIKTPLNAPSQPAPLALTA